MSNSKPVHRQFLFLVLAACVSATASAQTSPKRTDIGAAPSGILWVGNSFFYYNSSMHNHVSNLVRAADPKIAPRATSVTISGSGIDWHDMESYFRPDSRPPRTPFRSTSDVDAPVDASRTGLERESGART